jgi:putative DNA primase/helicase
VAAEVVDFAKFADKESRKWIQRFIASAFMEGAQSSQILERLIVQGVPDDKAKENITRVKGLAKPPRLTEFDLVDLGGRNGFRALFDLEPIVQPNMVEVPLDFQLSESGDAELFAQMHAEDLRYDHRQGRWLITDTPSGLWLPDKVEHVYNLALATTRERQRRAVNLEDHAKKKAMLEWAMHGESRSRLGNLLALAEKTQPLSDDGEHWDENPWLLGTRNGVIDLRTGQHRRAEPEERITMRVRVAYDAAAECPLWMQTLRGVFAGHIATSEGLLDQGDADETQRIIDFMQRALGYSITGDCREECCFFTWGEGANGKGTIMNTVGWMMGDYTDEMAATTLEQNVRGGGGIPSDLAKMAGKRFILGSETNEFTLNESRLKALTGRDSMTARFMYQDLFTFIPVGKIWIATNNKPKISGTDDGIWRRIHLIPFTNKFEGATKNAKLKDQLRDEMPGILNWLVRGAQLWLEHGLDPPEIVKAATEAYRQESDGLESFIEQRCVLAGRVQGSKVWEEYQSFAGGDDYKLGQKKFFQAFGKRFKRQENRQGQAEFLGVGLRQHGSEPSY